MKYPGFRVLGAGGRVLGVFWLAALLSAHVGSPDVFFSGKAGPYDIKVVVRPPEVVPGVARVTVTTPVEVTSVTIRPVYWRAGSRGAPSGDEMREVGPAQPGPFSRVLGTIPRVHEGSLWLMARGAYGVDVALNGHKGKGSVLVPVASVATGRLALNMPLAAMLIVLGVFLVTGLVNIVRKAAGESLLEPGRPMDAGSARTTRIAGGVAFVILVVAILGGFSWWNAVDRDYERTMYHPTPMSVSLTDGVLRVQASDTLYLPLGRPSTYVPDHGKLMHLFLIKASDAHAFAHLHPRPDDVEIPAFTSALPPLPPGDYRVYGDVVHETGFERTLVGSLTIPNTTPAAAARPAKLDPDDAWFVGDGSVTQSARLADGSVMTLAFDPATPPAAGSELSLRVTVSDVAGRPLALEPYLGMPAHAVVARLDGAVYVHLHTMGTVTMAAQDVFAARDRGDTTAGGKLIAGAHAEHQAAADRSASSVSSASLSFPYAFPKGGDYRLFVQVKRNGRVLTGAFAVPVVDSVARAQ